MTARGLLDLILLGVTIAAILAGVNAVDRLQERHHVSPRGLGSTQAETTAGMCYLPLRCTEHEYWHHQCLKRA